MLSYEDRKDIIETLVLEVINPIENYKEKSVKEYNKNRKENIDISAFDSIDEEKIKKICTKAVESLSEDIRCNIARIINDEIKKWNEFYIENGIDI